MTLDATAVGSRRPTPAAAFDFGAVAAAYDETVPFFATLGDALVGWAGIGPADLVLDVGAGRGAVTAAVLRRLGPTGAVLSTDVSEQMLADLAATGEPRLRTAVLTVEDLRGIEDAGVDVVTAGFVLHVVADRTRAVGEIRRVLRPGGRLAWSAPGPAADGGWGDHYAALCAEFTALVEVPAGMGAPEVPLSQLVAAAGFVEEEVTVVEVHLPVGGPQGYWEWLMSHGNRWLYDALDTADADRFRRRVLDGLTAHHLTGGHTLELAPTLHRCRGPAEPGPGCRGTPVRPLPDTS